MTPDRDNLPQSNSREYHLALAPHTQKLAESKKTMKMETIPKIATRRTPSPVRPCRSASARLFASSRPWSSFLSALLLVTLAIMLLPLSPEKGHSVEALRALKALAKTFVFQQLTQKKHFVPMPLPIPIPIEINEKPIYLKGKPKYVNVYKPKPTSPPATKPTTVFNMPIYSPSYEYMTMDPMSSMYSSPMVYAGPSSYKTAAAGLDVLDGGSSGASSHASGTGVDYDDETGNYYVRKSAARRSRQLAASDYGAYDYDMHRNDQRLAEQQHQQQQQSDAANRQHEQQSASQQDLAVSGSNQEEEDVEAPSMSNDDESYDHEGEQAHHRVKRQVYYESGYDGNTNCEGFPLEVNIRSRIKLDQVFPIHGRSQIKKCVKFKKSLLPPVHHDNY